MSYTQTVFFIPVWFDRFGSFTGALSKSALWQSVDPETYRPRYLLSYATRIAESRDRFQLFSLKDPSALQIHMFEDELKLPSRPEIQQVRFSCFSTGVGFLEFWVQYNGFSPEQVADFAFYFKKSTRAQSKKLPQGCLPLYDAAASLLPRDSDAKLFFTSAASFKYECNCFHFLHVDAAPGTPEEANLRLRRLSRSYNSLFSFSADSDYDLIYKPSISDQWGGSTEGLVNIAYDFDDTDSEYFMHNLKISHLCIDYYFLYLLLLNQRFSSIQYVRMVSTAYGQPQKQVEKLNRRIVELKTVFSFNVISDDRIYQNIYSKMSGILELERLLADIIDNESQMQMLQNASSIKAEKLSNKFLFGISILSLFSALIDASSYFDRFDSLQPISSLLGLGCVLATVIICVIWLVKGRK